MEYKNKQSNAKIKLMVQEIYSRNQGENLTSANVSAQPKKIHKVYESRSRNNFEKSSSAKVPYFTTNISSGKKSFLYEQKQQLSFVNPKSQFENNANFLKKSRNQKQKFQTAFTNNTGFLSNTFNTINKFFQSVASNNSVSPEKPSGETTMVSNIVFSPALPNKGSFPNIVVEDNDEETSENLDTSNRSIPMENSEESPESTQGNIDSHDIDENVRNKVHLKKPRIMKLVSENISSELHSGCTSTVQDPLTALWRNEGSKLKTPTENESSFQNLEQIKTLSNQESIIMQPIFKITPKQTKKKGQQKTLFEKSQIAVLQQQKKPKPMFKAYEKKIKNKSQIQKRGTQDLLKSHSRKQKSFVEIQETQEISKTLNQLPQDTMSEDYQLKIDQIHQKIMSDEKFKSFTSGQPKKLMSEIDKSIEESESALKNEQNELYYANVQSQIRQIKSIKKLVPTIEEELEYSNSEKNNQMSSAIQKKLLSSFLTASMKNVNSQMNEDDFNLTKSVDKKLKNSNSTFKNLRFLRNTIDSKSNGTNFNSVLESSQAKFDPKASMASLEKQLSKVYNFYNNSPTSNNYNSRNLYNDDPGESGDTNLQSEFRNIQIKTINGDVKQAISFND